MNHRFLAGSLAGICVVALTMLFSQPVGTRRSHPPAETADAKPARTASTPVDYNRDVLPILARSCFTCHGPDSGARKAGLRLDQREHALRPTKSGDRPIVPGKSADSEIMRRILASVDDGRMPPPRFGKPLTDTEKEVVRRWIDAGAVYQQHWAFVPPTRSAVPPVKAGAWVQTPIDAFVLARLEQEGWQPSPRADRATLIRRLSLDLRGLPPSLAELDEFLADDAPDAYEKLVDRMLASPRFGEKMALAWLDLARFGDTSGFHLDSTRQMWLWRDWVIDAFNTNMPFDQFTIEQLAGDLLPPPARPSLGGVSSAPVGPKIASGFHRNTRFNEEGGVDPEEYVIRYNIDRTNTLGQVWLGLTLGCAECHSHKYDPISHKEYYQLFAYFTGIVEPMKSGNHEQALPPLLKVPTPEQSKTLAEHRAMLAVIEKAIAQELARIDYHDPLADQPGSEPVERSQIAWERQEKKNDKLPQDVRKALQVEPAQRSEAQKNALRNYYLRKINGAGRERIGPLDLDYEDYTKKIQKIEDAIPHTLITEEMATPRPAYVLIRGDFLHKGEKVERAVPAIFPPLPPGRPNNRLGLAHWLVRPDHPLTARVQVNRLWAQMFGSGLVRSLGDFGSQGDHPSHRELLDWLACEFVAPLPRSGNGPAAHPWDVKHLLRIIALSATYQQVSIFPKVTTDPDNRLLQRASRHRLCAEEIRDSALAIAGLLSPKIGGPSFMPYQPIDFYKGKNELWPWTPSSGDDQYRRGIYTFWRRTSLHPMFAILDAPSRQECTVSRPRTNTPLQALVTLNDPSFMEAARVFAQKILTHAPPDLPGRLTYAFRAATCRPPNDAELRVLQWRYQQQFDRFAADRDAASKMINVGQSPRDGRLDEVELATWTSVAHLLLNLDEVLTRE